MFPFYFFYCTYMKKRMLVELVVIIISQYMQIKPSCFTSIKKKRSICFWLCWVFIAAHGLSVVVETWGNSVCGAQTLGAQASVTAARGLSSWSLQVLECWLSSCGAQAQLPPSIQDPPRPGTEPVFSALAGRLSTTGPPGKPYVLILYISINS